MRRVEFLLVLFFSALAYAIPPENSIVYVQVIRGTDREKPPGTDYREIGPKLSAKLSPVFRWKHYWETERRKVQLDPARITRVTLAHQRTLEIERLTSGDLEVRLFRRSGLVTKARQGPSGRMAILGGEDPSKDSFFVVVRHDEPIGPE